jgi:hypothetical protein
MANERPRTLPLCGQVPVLGGRVLFAADRRRRGASVLRAGTAVAWRRIPVVTYAMRIRTAANTALRWFSTLIVLAACAHQQGSRSSKGPLGATTATVVHLVGEAASELGGSKAVCIGVRHEQGGQVSDPADALLESLLSAGIAARPFSACPGQEIGVFNITLDPVEKVEPSIAVVQGNLGLLWAGRRFRVWLNGESGTWTVVPESAAR